MKPSLPLALFVILSVPPVDCSGEIVSALAPENQDHLRQMAAHWKVRRAISTASVTWSTVLYRDYKFVEGPPSGGATVKTSETYWLGPGQQRRHHQTGTQRIDSRTVSLNTVMTDNGRGVWKQLTVRPEDLPAPHGWIRAERWGQQSFVPVLLYFGRQVKLGAPDSFKILDTNYAVGTRTCIYVESPERVGQRIRRLAVDPERNYVVTQFDFVSAENELLLQFRIEYQPHPQLAWVPVRWTHTNWNIDGSLLDHRQATVTELEVNQNYPADTYDLQFPAGTVVDDEIQKTRFVVPATTEHPDTPFETVDTPVAVNWRVLLAAVIAAVVAVWAVLGLRSKQTS